MMKISTIPSIESLPQSTGKLQPARVGENFGQLLADQLQQVNRIHQEADQAIEQLATGKSDDIQNVVVSLAKADLTFRLVLEIRNRLIDSYQELMRMQV